MARAKGSLSKTFVWILLGLLIVGLAGFGATNLSGTVRTVGEVGEKPIAVDRYARALQNEIRAIEAETRQPLPFSQAQAAGIPDQVLSQLVIATALDEEARLRGLSVGDARLAQELRMVPAFQGASGAFDREAYRLTLESAGLSEAEFEENLRDETARTILQGAVLAGTALPASYVDTLLAYAGERRAFTWATLDETALEAGIAVPSDAELRAWYDDNIDRFTQPQTKRITYAWVTPDMIVDTVEVDEAALRAAYDAASADYNLPERRLVERLVFADDAAAQDAANRLAAGEVSFEDLVAERGLALSDIDLGDVTRADLAAAGDAVFALSPGEVSAPLPTSLGPALFRVNGVLAAQTTSFEEAEPELRDALALDRARRVIAALAPDADDQLAAGATLEELARDTQLELGSIGWFQGADADIAGYESFRDAAEAVTEDDFPQIDELGDGGIFALRLDAIEPPAPRPFDEVQAAVAEGWRTDQVTDALSAQAETLAAELSEGRTFVALGLDPREEPGLTRSGRIEGLPPGVIDAVFDADPGEIRRVRGPGTVTLIRLDDILPPDRDSENAQALAQILADQAAGDVAQDLFRALSADIQRRLGVQINQQALNAVHTQFQ